MRLVPESRYRIQSAGGDEEPIETEGVFKGITSIGSIDALVIELAKEVKGAATRLIPTHAILALDVLEQAEHAEEKEDMPAHYV